MVRLEGGMKSQKRTIFLVLILTCFVGFSILAFSSVTAVDCFTRVKGGAGTVEDPLRIEVVGNAGLTPILDSLLPFSAIPSIHLSYAGERFYIPAINSFFIGKQPLAIAIYLALILLFVVCCFWLALRISGKRLAIVDSRSNRLRR